MQPTSNRTIGNGASSQNEHSLTEDNTYDRMGSIELIEHQATVWRRRKRWTIGLSGLSFLTLVIIIFSPVYIPVGIYNSLYSYEVFSFLFFGGLIGLLVGILMRPLSHSAFQRVWDVQGPEAIGSLLEATRMMMPDVRNRAIRSLTDTLPSVTEDEATKLTPYQRDCLMRLFIVIGQPSLYANVSDFISHKHVSEVEVVLQHQQSSKEVTVVALFRVIGWCGSTKELQVVKRIADGHGFATNNLIMRQAAIACVASLTARIQNLSYLRPAAPQQPDVENLLRPIDATKTPVDLLLRPSDDNVKLGATASRL